MRARYQRFKWHRWRLIIWLICRFVHTPRLVTLYKHIGAELDVRAIEALRAR